MRICLLLIASLSLISSAAVIAQTPSAAASPPSGAAALNVLATWEPRTLKNFATMGVPDCDDLVEYVRFALLSLGAQNLHIDQRGCRGPSGPFRSVDATFSVLAPANKSDGQASGHTVEARWQTVEIQAETNSDLSNCGHARYVTRKVLPLFSARDVKDISTAVCDKFGVGLRAQVLVPAQPLADAR
ncbi:MAG: hypothetical protein WA825_13260 [Steroidobacteraceae bacterium]